MQAILKNFTVYLSKEDVPIDELEVAMSEEVSICDHEYVLNFAIWIEH